MKILQKLVFFGFQTLKIFLSALVCPKNQSRTGKQKILKWQKVVYEKQQTKRYFTWKRQSLV